MAGKKISAAALLADGQGEVIGEPATKAPSAADLMAEGGEVLVEDPKAAGSTGAGFGWRDALTMASPLANLATKFIPESYEGAPRALVTGATNSGLYGALPQVMAAGDATDLIGGYDGPDTPSSLSDVAKRLGGRFMASNRAGLEFAKHPIDTAKKWHDIYSRQVPKYRDERAKMNEAHPAASFIGAVVPGLASAPKSIGQAALMAGATGFGSSEELSQGKTDGASLANTALSTGLGAGMGALGFKSPLAAGGVGLGAAAFGDKIGMSDNERMQTAAGGLMSLGSGAINAFSRPSGMATKNRTKAENEIAALLVEQDHGEAKKMFPAFDDMMGEQAASRKAGLKDFDVKARYRRMKASAADRAEAKEKANNYKEVMTARDDLGKKRDALKKDYDSELDTVGEGLRKSMKDRLAEEVKANSVAKDLEDDAVVDAFKTQERAGEEHAALQAKARKESDDATIEAFLAEERARGKTGTSDAQPDLEAQLDGMLGNKVKEGFQFMRTKDPMKLALSPEAEAGVANILPDYEAKANETLGEFAKGKAAVREALRQQLEAERAASNPAQIPGEKTAIGTPPEEMLMEAMAGGRSLKPDTQVSGPAPHVIEAAQKASAKRPSGPADVIGDDKFWRLAKEIGIKLGNTEDLYDASAADLVPDGLRVDVAKRTGADEWAFGGRDLVAAQAAGGQVGTKGARPINSKGGGGQDEGSLYDVDNLLAYDHFPDGSKMPKKEFFGDEPAPFAWEGYDGPTQMETALGTPSETTDFAPWDVPEPTRPSMESRVRDYVKENVRKDAEVLAEPKRAAKEAVGNKFAQMVGADTKPVLPATVRVALYGQIEKTLASRAEFAAKYGPALAAAAQKSPESREAFIGWLMDNDPEFVKGLQSSEDASTTTDGKTHSGKRP